MKYRDHAEILPLLEGAGESWAHVKDDDTRHELRTTLAFGFAEINGASALLQWLVRGHGEGRPIFALLNEAARDIDEDGPNCSPVARRRAAMPSNNYHAYAEILPELDGFDFTGKPLPPEHRDRLDMTLTLATMEANGAAALLEWLTREHAKGRPLNALLDAAFTQIDDDGRHLQRLRAQLGGSHAKR